MKSLQMMREKTTVFWWTKLKVNLVVSCRYGHSITLKMLKFPIIRFNQERYISCENKWLECLE